MQVNVDLTVNGMRLLMLAVMSPERDVRVLRALLAAGADPNTPHVPQPLHMACYYDAPLSFVTALLDAGAQVGSPTQPCSLCACA
jgi:ankyrin repeat protein